MVEPFQLLRELHDAAVEAAAHLRFNKMTERDRNIIALYCSVLEFSSSTILLIQNRASSAVPVLFRALLEAYVDFKNLVKDPSYSRFMQAAYLSEWLKILREAAKKANPYLSGISRSADLAEAIENQDKRLKELEAQGFKPLKHSQRFERANMENEYRSIYNFVCSQSHNNLRALIERHIELADEDFRVVLFKGHGAEELSRYVCFTSDILRDVSRKIHELYGVED